MKKLMIAACAFAFAAVANAATASWATDENVLLNPSGVDVGWDDNGYVQMYLWSIDKTTYDAYAALAAADISAAVWNDYQSLEGYTDYKAENGNGNIQVDDTKTTYGVGDTAYAAILLTYDEGDGITHYKGNVGSFYFDADFDNATLNMDSYVFGDPDGTALGWTEATAAPEPTSGLLLLLGVAGLALRRKQK